MKLQNQKHIHFVGIKGVGMTPLAIIAREAGFHVTGCDTQDVYITDELLAKAGIKIENGFNTSHIDGVDMVVTTGAHEGYSNPEVQKAKEMKIPVYTQGEAVGLFMKGEIFEKKEIQGISVTGCHGKTTTTGMLATILQEVGFDPSFLIGTGLVPSLGTSGHFGHGTYFIAEADEYANEPQFDKSAKFLSQHPKIAIITNIEFDHPDIYQTIDNVRKAYATFAQQVATDGGLLIVNGDDPQINTLLETYTGEVITFGENKDNDYILSSKHPQKFVLRVAQEDWESEFSLAVFGLHNIKNATAAIIVARELGIGEKDIQKGLNAFVGTKRRLEYQGMLGNGALVYDDYAHHPTEIRATLKSIREKYPERHILCVFQPHTFSRTKLLFEDFIDSFENADKVILVDIFPSAREPQDTSITSKMLSDALIGKGKVVFYISNPEDVVQYVNQNKEQFGQNTVIITMGAGDIYQIAKELIQL